jgi:hypothetical protein
MKKTAPHVKLLGKILFPKQAPWEQRTSALILLWAIAAGVLMGGLIAAFMLLRNGR